MTARRIVLSSGADQAGFRRALRLLVAEDAPADAVTWETGGTPGLFGETRCSQAPPIALPRDAVALIDSVVCHRDPERYALLHAFVRRLLQGERDLLDVASDPLVHRLGRMRKAVARDIHKMHAFLRFRRADGPDGSERYAAWFEPAHFILEAAAPFFVERFGALVWSILTPVGALHWDGTRLAQAPAAARPDIPEDGFEAGWRDYYMSTFNPARLNLSAMRSEMPRKYWHNMPETAVIPSLVRDAPARVRAMLDREAAMPVRKDPTKAVAAMADQGPKTLAELNAIIAASAPLVPGGGRAVLGEGPLDACIACVGEQPGDVEDMEGRPFVGPAGQLLDRALAEAGIDRGRIYLTNAVKHFKFEQRGKRRIHQKPTTGEVKHYRWWLMQELDFVQPRLVVALGATAVLALAGKAIPITRARGPAMLGARPGYITVHPAYILRLPDAAARAHAYRDFVADLGRARTQASEAAGRPLTAEPQAPTSARD